MAIGDKVKIKTQKEEYRGIMMPSAKDSVVVIKLDSGYNIGVNKKSIKKITILDKIKTKTEKKENAKRVKDAISILHTGGTIASKVDYKTGAVSAKFSPDELLGMFPELKNIAPINSRLIANIMSDDLRFFHFNLIAQEIKKEAEAGAIGIIITMGTDNLAVASAALRFIIDNVTIPVLLVGAQRSSDRGSSDAALNLLSAAYFIKNSDFADIALCMHKTSSDDICQILPATKTRKFHTSRRDAFRPINVLPWADVDFANKKITVITKDYKKRNKNKITLQLYNEKIRIGILKVHVNMFAEEILAYKNFDGLILELTGLGHAPINTFDDATKEHKKIKDALKLIAGKIPVVASPMCIYGRLDMDVYSPGRELQSLGVLGNFSDMITETAFLKLAWLISNYDKNKVKEMIAKNSVGELSERTIPDAFLY